MGLVKEKIYQQGLRNYAPYQPYRKVEKNSWKCDTTAEIGLLASIFSFFLSFFCYSVHLWSLRDTFLHPSRRFPFSPVFHTSSQFAVLGREHGCFLVFPLFSLSPWESMLWKELIIGWHSSCFSVSWSLRLPLSLFHSCFIFWPLTHTPTPPFPPLLSFNFIWGWGPVKILSLFLSFTMLLSAFSAIVSH